MDSIYSSFSLSTGQKFVSSEWLDLHYKFAQLEYEEVLNAVGIVEGDHVLDAGCGNGVFINAIRKLVGRSGRITCLDLAYENCQELNSRYRIPDNVGSSQGTVTSLPYSADTFDVVWCSSVTQYLEDSELDLCLDEFARILKQDGILAIKEWDGASFFFQPASPLLLWKSALRLSKKDRFKFIERPLLMYEQLKRRGFTEVQQSTTLVERRHPLKEYEFRFLETYLAADGGSWVDYSTLPKNDRIRWQLLVDSKAEQYLLYQPDFYWREGHILTIGRFNPHSNQSE